MRRYGGFATLLRGVALAFVLTATAGAAAGVEVAVVSAVWAMAVS